MLAMNLLTWIIIITIVVVFGFFVYQRAVGTRKYYKCSECNESFRTEFMDAKICKVCGADINLSESDSVSDKTK